jgi:hypothetical protein
MSKNKHYDMLKKTALSVGAGVVLISGHKVNDVFPFTDSLVLNRINEINNESGYTIRDINNKKNKDASKELAASVLVSYITDIDNFYMLLNKDHNTLGQVTIALFVLVILLTGIILL